MVITVGETLTITVGAAGSGGTSRGVVVARLSFYEGQHPPDGGWRGRRHDGRTRCAGRHQHGDCRHDHGRNWRRWFEGVSNVTAGGGGGAGGYSAAGGGGFQGAGDGAASTGGGGGGGRGGGSGGVGGGGGGTGLGGAGSNGAGGATTNGTRGGGGSGGTGGTVTPIGGTYGGGGGGDDDGASAGNGGPGGVRIRWLTSALGNTTGGTETVDGAYTYTDFTTSGSWVATAPPDTNDELLANDVENASSVSVPAIHQKHKLLANDVENASGFSPGPASGPRLLANDVESTSEVSVPALHVVKALLANDVQSTSEVSVPVLHQKHALLANDVENASLSRCRCCTRYTDCWQTTLKTLQFRSACQRCIRCMRYWQTMFSRRVRIGAGCRAEARTVR